MNSWTISLYSLMQQSQWWKAIRSNSTHGIHANIDFLSPSFSFLLFPVTAVPRSNFLLFCTISKTWTELILCAVYSFILAGAITIHNQLQLLLFSLNVCSFLLFLSRISSSSKSIPRRASKGKCLLNIYSDSVNLRPFIDGSWDEEPKRIA